MSVLGLGTVKLGRNQGVKYPTAFTLPSDQEVSNLLALAKELGINLIDTAPAYGTSEERLGKLLCGARKDWVITTKVGEEFVNGESSFDFSPQAIVKSIERSLMRLNTDYLDVVLVHSSGEDESIIEEDEVFHTLEYLKVSGKIRAYGMSTKTIEGGKLAVELSDVVMMTYNPTYTDEREIIQLAHEKQKGIFIKKAFASGHLNQISAEDPVKHALQFIFAEPGVTSVILGTINPKHLQQNVTVVNELTLSLS